MRTFHMQKGTLITPPHVVYDLQQPVVTIIPVAYPLAKTGTQECDGANWLVVMGLLGQVVFLSSVTDRSTTLEEPNDSPFLPHTPLRVENKCTLKKKKKIVSNEGGVINGPIASACLVGGARLCYTVGSVVFITELFENVSTGVENSRSTENAPMKLPSQRISVSNVAAITGPGLFPYHGTHSLVVLTGAGRLFSIKASKQMASAGNLGVDCCQDSYSGRSVKVSFSNTLNPFPAKLFLPSRRNAGMLLSQFRPHGFFSSFEQLTWRLSFFQIFSTFDRHMQFSSRIPVV